MATAALAYRSSISVGNISKTVSSLGEGVTRAQASANKINGVLFKKTRVSREAISRDRISFQRRRESVRRREQEDIVEASGIGGAIKRQGKVISSSTRGFLGRILDFIGTLMVGWLVNNLPTIISLAEQLIGRIQRLVGVLGGFVGGVTKILSGFGNLLSGTLSNIMSFDFIDQSNQIANSMQQMQNGFKDIELSIDEGIRVLSEPFDLSPKKEEQQQPTPEQQPGTTYEGPGGPETTAGGKVVTPQAVYSYLRQLGVPHIHAVGIVANIKGESGFRIDADETGKGTGGIGLFQYTFPSRKQRFLQAVPDWRTNWKGQVSYAIKNDENTPIYLRKQFRNPEEAADDFMRNWENPSRSVYAERRRKHNEFIRTFKPGGQEKPAQTTSPGTQTVPSPTAQTNIDPSKRFKKGEQVQGVGTITSLRGPRVDPITGRSGSTHGGLDIGMDVGIYISCKLPAVVAYAGTQGGYGKLIDITIPSLNITLRFAHLSSILITSGQIPAGKPFARSGNSGTRTTGPHVHMEAFGPNATAQQVAYGGDRSPDPYVSVIMFTAKPPQGFVAPAVTTGKPAPAQISTTPLPNVSQQITTERRGPTIAMMPMSPQMPQTAPLPMGAGGGGGVSAPKMDEQTALNRLILQRLLLDLAYT